MVRSTYFIQIRPAGRDLLPTLFLQDPRDFFHGCTDDIRPENIIVRRERQTFRRLPRSDAVLFTVKTTLTPLPELSDEDLAGAASEMKLWPEEIAQYKGREHFEKQLLDYCHSTFDMLVWNSLGSAPNTPAVESDPNTGPSGGLFPTME